MTCGGHQNDKRAERLYKAASRCSFSSNRFPSAAMQITLEEQRCIKSLHAAKYRAVPNVKKALALGRLPKNLKRRCRCISLKTDRPERAETAFASFETASLKPGWMTRARLFPLHTFMSKASVDARRRRSKPSMTSPTHTTNCRKRCWPTLRAP